MELTLGQVFSVRESVSKLLTECLPVKVSYLIGKVARAIAPEFTEVEKQRMELVKKYGTPVEDKPGTFEVKDDNKEVFFKEVNELFATKIDLEVKPINASLLENAKVSPAELITLIDAGILVDDLGEAVEAKKAD